MRAFCQRLSGSNVPALFLVFAAMSILAASPVHARRPLFGGGGNAAAEAEKTLITIKAVTPDAEKRSVAITFSIPDLRGVPSALEEGIRFFPPVSIRWHAARSDAKSTVVLTGDFKPGKTYRLVVPSDFDWGNYRVAHGAREFTVPDLSPALEFPDEGSVVERDSRQMAPLAVTNVPEVVAESLRIPPALVPVVLNDGQPGFGFDYPAVKARLNNAVALLEDAAQAYTDLAPFLGRPVESRSIFFPGAEKNLRKTFSLPLSFREGKENGSIEAVRVRPSSGAAPSDARLFRITDLSIVYKIGGRSLLVWTTSLRTGKPIAGAAILGMTGGGAAVPLGKTDKNGILVVRPKGNGNLAGAVDLLNEKGPSPAKHPVRLPSLRFLAAAAGNDGTFVRIGGDAAISPDWVPTAAPPSPAVSDRSPRAFGKTIHRTRAAAAPLNAGGTGARLLKGHLFSERGVYRPGDTVHLKATAREYRNGTVVAPAGTSVTLTVENPRQEIVLKKTLSLSDFGTASHDLETKASWPHGTYTAKIAFGGGEPPSPAPPAPPADAEERDDEEPIEVSTETVAAGPGYAASSTFELAEFRAPRHFASVTFRKETARDPSYVNVVREETRLRCTIAGTYYAGGPVKNGRVRWKLSYAPTSFRTPPGLSDFTFGHVLDRKAEFLESGETTLDDSGSATIVLPLSAEVVSGRYSVRVDAAVVDFDGRVASETGTYQETPGILVGLSAHDEQARAGESQILKIVVANADGKKVPKGTVVAEVSRKRSIYVRKRNDEGKLYWSWEETYRRQSKVALSLRNGEAPLTLDFSDGGTYIVNVAYAGEDGRAASSSTMFEVTGGYGYDVDPTARTRKFEKLAATADRKRYAPGDTARIHLSPSRKLSAVLLTVERAGILEARLVSLSGDRPSVQVPIGSAFSPNVFVGLLGTVPRGEFASYAGEFDSEAPSFLYGCVPLDVKGNAAALSLSIAPGRSSLAGSPGERKSVDLSVRNAKGKGTRAEIAVAVVDEAVLALTGYRTPSLEDLAKFTVPLSVTSGDSRMELLRQVFFGFVRNDRLTGGDGGDLTVTKTRRDFRAVAFFDPAVRTDDSGNATVTFTVPDSMTTYRVFAVACDNGAGFASGQREMLVTKEFYVEPGAPRFLTRGDRFRLLLSATNGTDNAGTATFTAAGDDRVSLALARTETVLAGRDRTLLPADGEAKAPGTSLWRFAGTFDGKTDAVELRIPVRSGYVSQSDYLFGTFEKEVSIPYAFPPGTEKIPWNSLDPSEVSARVTVSGSPFLRIAPGLRYLLQYPYGCVEQTSSTLMPIAAIRGLAKKGLLPGITPEETDRFIEKGVSRLLSMEIPGGGFGYWPGDREMHDWGTVYALSALLAVKAAGGTVPQDAIDKGIRALEERLKTSSAPWDGTLRGYALYLRARAGVPPAEADAYRSFLPQVDRMPREAALLYLSGLKIANLLPEGEIRAKAKTVLERPPEKRDTGWFHATYREPAVALLCAALIVPEDPVAGKLAGSLLGGFNRRGYWSSTSDTGWALLALSEYFSRTAFRKDPVSVTFEQAGWPPTTVSVPPEGSYEYTLEPGSFLKNPRVKISTSSGGTLTYLLALVFPRVDLSNEGEEKGLRVRKEFATLDGRKEVRVGDIVKVTVTIEATQRNRWNEYAYLVLDDPVPAGYEAINTSFKSEESTPGRTGESGRWAYWDDESRTYRFVPDRFEIRDDRVLAFRNSIWMGNEAYRFTYYARAILEGTFAMPPTKVQLLYEPDVGGYSPARTVTVLGK